MTRTRSVSPRSEAPGTVSRAPIFAFHDISVRFGATPILDQIRFDVTPEEFLCLVGPSGCGKTTLLRVAAGLIRPQAGRAEFEGRAVAEPTPELAIVFQDYSRALLPWRTVAGNVELALEARGAPRAGRAAEVRRLLSIIGLADHAAKFPLQLSGGMQQRVQIARALAQRPRILLMDEPFGSLDAMTRQALQDEIARLCKAERQTVIFVTHDLEEAIYLGDRVVALKANPGRVVEIVEIALPRPRDQLTTREHPRFLEYRHRLFRHLAKEEAK
jgi:NitT/TauT family transport system ATP-binding protein